MDNSNNEQKPFLPVTRLTCTVIGCPGSFEVADLYNLVPLSPGSHPDNRTRRTITKHQPLKTIPTFASFAFPDCARFHDTMDMLL
jgi:hypothetical protein